MNYAIAKPNTKGQLVIPQAMRKALGITPNTHLHLSLEDKIITITPLSPTLIKTKKSLYEILKSTQGAWEGDNWPETEAKQRKIEIKAAKELGRSW